MGLQSSDEHSCLQRKMACKAFNDTHIPGLSLSRFRAHESERGDHGNGLDGKAERKQDGGPTLEELSV